MENIKTLNETARRIFSKLLVYVQVIQFWRYLFDKSSILFVFRPPITCVDFPNECLFIKKSLQSGQTNSTYTPSVYVRTYTWEVLAREKLS